MLGSLTAKRNSSIDALRAVAAIMVLVCHSYVPRIGIYSYDYFLKFFHTYGPLGVDLFFVLSGFCIHWSCSKPGAVFSKRKYLLRRWWRIYPAYFFALGFAVIVNLTWVLARLNTVRPISLDNFGSFQILSHIFMIFNFFDSTVFAINTPFWTIAVEIQFYLIYLMIIPMLSTKKGWGILFLLTFILHFTAWHFHGPGNPLKYWLEWVIGAFVAYFLRNDPSIIRHRFFYGLLFVVGCWAGNHFMKIKMEQYSRPLFAISFVFLLLFFLHYEKIWSSTILRGISSIGTFSYSLYLIQGPLTDLFRRFLVLKFLEGWARLAASLFSICACVGLSYIYFLVCEKPFLIKSATIGITTAK